MPKPLHLILGCGYVGRRLALRLAGEGGEVVGTSRTNERQPDIESAGASFVPFTLGKTSPEAIFTDERKARLCSVTILFGPREPSAARDLRTILNAVPRTTLVTVLVSTAVYGGQSGLLTETTLPSPTTPRSRAWLDWEVAALSARTDGRNVAVVRCPAIYGPGRAMRAKIKRGEAIAIRPARHTSRIHADDLAALFARMLEHDRPPILLAADDCPAPTWRVMKYASTLLQGPLRPSPREITREEAPEYFTTRGIEMRTRGTTCRSVTRPWLNTPLKYPTYREGYEAIYSVDERVSDGADKA